MPEFARGGNGVVHIETTSEERAANRRRHAEKDRNVDYWNDHYLELSKQHRNKWLLIYDGCTVRVFDGLQEMWDAEESLTPWQRETAFEHFVRSKARVG
ncbi:MAG: hypothetical protein F4X58_09400 [Chloroflexi bacterium]|nr:hypothetical protein [Chloroflexota bacterium]MXV79610.1 hypothetical protein [Chloroflexota bacterium]MYC02120.1 hypothetical protein [Chloroflexota bacterium]